MRGEIVYRVYGQHEGRDKDSFFGAFRSAAEAEAEIALLNARDLNGRNWAQQYHNRGFAIREAVVDTDFEIPSLPKPRDKYAIRAIPKPNRPGTWSSAIVEVFRRGNSSRLAEKVAEYERNYSMLQTFEPFRQRNREFALISRDYTSTAVLDLATGQVVAEEIEKPGMRPGGGFCPVGFYVPDWWDVNDDSVIPGSEFWDADHEWPSGDFGFVWGCLWGDDSSWKIQLLDLSRVQEGIIKREERFGYVELATIGFKSPCLELDLVPPRNSDPPPFVRLSKRKGECKVTFAVEMEFRLDSGKSEWQRIRIENLE